MALVRVFGYFRMGMESAGPQSATVPIHAQNQITISWVIYIDISFDCGSLGSNALPTQHPTRSYNLWENGVDYVVMIRPGLFEQRCSAMQN